MDRSYYGVAAVEIIGKQLSSGYMHELIRSLIFGHLKINATRLGGIYFLVEPRGIEQLFATS